MVDGNKNTPPSLSKKSAAARQGAKGGIANYFPGQFSRLRLNFVDRCSAAQTLPPTPCFVGAGYPLIANTVRMEFRDKGNRSFCKRADEDSTREMFGPRNMSEVCS